MDFDNPGTFTFNNRSGDVVVPKINWVEPLKTEIDHFVDCIQNGADCITGPSHAEKVVHILERA
jgi:predicted dehydrogenase